MTLNIYNEAKEGEGSQSLTLIPNNGSYGGR